MVAFTMTSLNIGSSASVSGSYLGMLPYLKCLHVKIIRCNTSLTHF